MKQLFPDYNGKNTVNLISSIKNYCGIKSDEYSELDLLTSKELKKYDNVVLFLVDALGYNWLEKYGKGSFLYSKMTGNITSTFLSTTTSAVTTFNTGFTPSEHAVMGWNMYSKELSSVIQIFSWLHKITKTSLGEKINISDILPKDSFYKESKKDVFIVTSNGFKDGVYNSYNNRYTKTLGYDDLFGVFQETINAINYNKKQKYIFSYWGEFDRLSHDYGIDSLEVKKHFEDLDYQFEKLEKSLSGTNTLIVVTADHGQLNCTNIINVKEIFPEIYDLLLLPFSGEPRVQFCFVKNSLQETFYESVKSKLGKYCDIYRKSEVLEMKLFGYGKNEKFIERIGDFILIAKDDFLLTDGTDNIHIGNHGGLTEWEILVPIIKI